MQRPFREIALWRFSRTGFFFAGRSVAQGMCLKCIRARRTHAPLSKAGRVGRNVGERACGELSNDRAYLPFWQVRCHGNQKVGKAWPLERA